MALPIKSTVPDIFVGTLFFNYKQWGWSEKYYLFNPPITDPANIDYVAAANILIPIVNDRAKMMAAGVTLAYARVSSFKRSRESFPVISSPLIGSYVDEETTALEVLNQPNDALLFRVDDNQGRWAMRSLRGLRDSWINDALKVVPGTLGSPTQESTLRTLATPPVSSDVMFNYWVRVFKDCCIAKKAAGETFAVDVYPMKSLTFRRTTARDTGRPFGLSRGRAPSRV